MTGHVTEHFPASIQTVLPSSGFQAEVAVDGGAACSDDLAYVCWLQALLFEFMGLFDVGVGGGDFLSSCLAAVVGGDGHAGFGAFGELVAFELGESGDDGDHGLCHGSAQLAVRVGGDPVAQRTELDASGLEAVE